MRVARLLCALRPEKGRLSWVPTDRRRGLLPTVRRALTDSRARLLPTGPRAYARPSFSAAVAASTGTVTGCGAPATAQSGSLSPLPVTVQTIF